MKFYLLFYVEQLKWGKIIMEKKFVCPGGLACCDCLFYKPEIYDTAKKLKRNNPEFSVGYFS